jgi:outer membrane protein
MRMSRVVLARLLVPRLFVALILALAAPAALAQPAPRNVVPAGPGMARTLATSEPDSVPHTLAETLGIAYETNPQLTGERAHLRSTDENVPTALAGWRPTVAVTGNYGYGAGKYIETQACGSTGGPGCVLEKNSKGQVNFNDPYGAQTYPVTLKNNRYQETGQATVTQYLYRGGHTTSATHEAVNSVYAERARLIAEEEQVFSDTINAYVGVVEDRQLLALDHANEQVLGDELRAITDRFKVGELTRTDVAQAEAALAQAIATRQTAEGTLETANATFVREVGVQPPADLADPQPLVLPVKSQIEAADLSIVNNPTVIAAKFNEAELRDAVDVAFSALGPQISLQGTSLYQSGSSLAHQETYGAAATLNVTIPLYQGGQEYAAIRQARQSFLQAVRETEDAQRAARQQAVQAYETLIAARDSIASSRVAVRSSEIALEGLEREALVGSATTQEVLIGQQNLLSAQITLVQNITSMVTASYGVASAIGRLTAQDLGLQVPLYDETAYYRAVKDLLWGTGDRAVHQPGR